ncbi:hypothetical protein [Streptomyces sp. NRRL S-87]|uniref:hypothetical protein n=1 Tax=Streptomyces sp. NRRL S-87 TaxID=1463920 RepID=UPI00131A8101|nr:hypothetical protein [Streptomyces sp. NRRL S-87]
MTKINWLREHRWSELRPLRPELTRPLQRSGTEGPADRPPAVLLEIFSPHPQHQRMARFRLPPRAPN